MGLVFVQLSVIESLRVLGRRGLPTGIVITIGNQRRIIRQTLSDASFRRQVVIFEDFFSGLTQLSSWHMHEAGEELVQWIGSSPILLGALRAALTFNGKIKDDKPHLI